MPEQLSGTDSFIAGMFSRGEIMWHIYTELEIPVIAEQPLSSDQFVFVDKTRIYREAEVRPSKDVLQHLKSNFYREAYVFFVYCESWLDAADSGIYIFTGNDVMEDMPVITQISFPEDYRSIDSLEEVDSLIDLVGIAGLEKKQIVELVLHNAMQAVPTGLELPQPE